MAERREVLWRAKGPLEDGEDGPHSFQRRNADIELTITRKGIWVSGYYDGGYGGLCDDKMLTWAEIDEMRAEVNKKAPVTPTLDAPEAAK